MEPDYCPYCGGHYTLERDEEDGESTASSGDIYVIYYRCTKCSQKFGIS